MAHSRDTEHRNTWTKMTKPANIALLAFLIVGGFYLVTEHRAHLWGILPFFLILICPLMHLFMHHGHQHGRATTNEDSDPASPGGTPSMPVESVKS